MSLIEWNPSYSVSIGQFDRQHQKLFSLLNELNDAMSRAEGRHVTEKVLGELMAYAGTHFADEEKVMAEKHYPGLTTHRKEHDEFVNRVNAFRTSFGAGDPGVSRDVLEFLKEWLTTHIRGTDKEYAGYLNDKGIH